MSFIESERQKSIKNRNEIFNDLGGGSYKSAEREFYLFNPLLNLFEGIREDVIEYFHRYNIPFWDGGKTPTGHLLSSQIACVNHLFFIRQREDVASSILKAIDKDVKMALRLVSHSLDSGFVDFEVVGNKNYLGEKNHSRGANSTSVDAVMLGELINGDIKLFFIEWKYVEQYKNSGSKHLGESGKTRFNIYNPLLSSSDCPLNAVNIDGLFTEPYYQLMRQTLLAHEMIKAKEYGANDYMHLHIIPTLNKEMKEINTAFGKLEGLELNDTWKKVLKSPEKYRSIDPNEFLKPAYNCPDTKSVLRYLDKRYWKEVK